jgi:hypothetical protein
MLLGVAGLLAAYLAPHSTLLNYGMAIVALLWAAAAMWKRIRASAD